MIKKPRLPRLSRAGQYTLFATALLVGGILAFYVIIIADMLNALAAQDIEAGLATFVQAHHILLLIAAAAIAFTISSVIIENILNPLRQMTLKMKEIGEMNFGKPLELDPNDDELREYAFTFNTMAAKLNRFIETQKRFVSDASHELATPITVINGHADLLLRRAAADPALLQNSLSVIKQEILQMSNLVDSLLLLARNDSGTQSYTFTQTDIFALAQNSIEEARLLSPHHTLKLQAQPNITAKADEYAILRVLRILLTNAIKYSPPKTTITATVTQSHGIVYVSVKDQGIGISEEHLPRIFERFYRADPSRTRKTGSSGLGLSIAKEIITAHGGQIEATSTPNQGTEVVFKI